ncbi:MAG: type I-C CRISPR-associated protein Cas8c/Csd1 [Actinobacteria bacterium]|nr:type I-C CRISPR-associated protein Cas8c/Csd1 [Actinomycetota bacterium]
MLLSALKALSEGGDRLPYYYTVQRVGYRIDLDRQGHLLSFIPVKRNEPSLAIPCITRTSKPLPLPVDKGEYVLGMYGFDDAVLDRAAKDKMKIKKISAERTPAIKKQILADAQNRHSLWRALVDEMFDATKVAELEALISFVDSMEFETLALPESFNPNQFIAIYINGAFFPDDRRIQAWWKERQLESDGSKIAASNCSVCGQRAEVVETISIQVRGLSSIGGKSGMALISANSNVFERHGLKRATGASVCAPCGEASHQALNALIADPTRSKSIGNSKLLWWTSEPIDDFIGALLAGDTDDSVGRVFDAVLKGHLVPPVNSARFFAVTIGANVNRVVVRSWLDITLAEAIANAKNWIERATVADRQNDGVRRPGVWAMLAGLAPPGSGSTFSRVAPGVVDDVLRSALTGTRLPDRVLAACLGRIRSEQGRITVGRAALLSAYLSKPNNKEVPIMSEFQEQGTDPAFTCGRLLCLLDQASRLATSPKNSLIDRSYAAASTMPALTFPRLLRLNRAHMGKLKRDKPGAAYRIEQGMEELMGTLDNFPRALSSAEQGRFALGLYNQQASDRAAARAAKAQKGAGSEDVFLDDSHSSEALTESEV